MKKIKVREGDLKEIIAESVSMVLNEISPKLLARAYVGANVDYNDLSNSNDDVALNKNGRKVYRDTQKDRRERQLQSFSQKMGDDLSKQLGRNVKISKDSSGDDVSYYGEINRGHRPIYHHYSHVNGDDPTNSYHGLVYYSGGKSKNKIDRSDMDAADYVTDFTDAMAGYHDELTGGRSYKNRINSINDRINDVENIRKYKDELSDYENAEHQNKMDRLEYDSLPWYRKIGKEKPQKFTREKPTFPKLKTGPYFMPDNPEGLMKQAERIKQNRKQNIDKYNRLLKR